MLINQEHLSMLSVTRRSLSLLKPRKLHRSAARAGGVESLAPFQA